MRTGVTTEGGLGAAFLFTDYTLSGPYVGQLHARLHEGTDGRLASIDLMHDAPAFRPDLGAYLLAAVIPHLSAGATVLAVVDPGVGTDRAGLGLWLDGRWVIGPDNGLLAIAAQRAQEVSAYQLPPAEAAASATFHGRDVFAKAAAAVGTTAAVPSGFCPISDWVGRDWAIDWDVVVYQDGFGNLMTGRRVETAPEPARLEIAGCELPRARKFADVSPGEAFWYGNAMGLVEVAVNAGSAAKSLGAGPGTSFYWSG